MIPVSFGILGKRIVLAGWLDNVRTSGQYAVCWGDKGAEKMVIHLARADQGQEGGEIKGNGQCIRIEKLPYIERLWGCGWRSTVKISFLASHATRKVIRASICVVTPPVTAAPVDTTCM